jgi:uncharacterized protein YndB with AHSA1/START domain
MFYLEKNYKKTGKRFLYLLLFLFLIIAGVVAFSPYGRQKGFSYKLIKHSIDINAPAERVFDFLGNSHNASRWSSFVSHITVLNPDSFTDGTSGSRRRCFRNKNEKGMQWDELIIEAAANKKRQLSIYNLKDFSMTAGHLATEQLYEVIGVNKCRLTFTVFFKDATPTIGEAIKMYIAAYMIEPVFKRNLSNIKRISESEQ